MVESMPAKPLPHVVIVGGGFGGLYAAKRLRGKPVRITLLDRRNFHLFQPFLYQVATAGLSPGDIAAPIRSILRRQRNATVLLAEAEAVELATRQVILTDHSRLSYDYLILATGSRHSYFNHNEWELLAPGLKSIEDALEIRRRVLRAFEAAERESDPAVRKALLTFVVVGGGPTGVEMAGALAEIARYTMVRDFRVIDSTQTRVILLEAAPRILITFPESLAEHARQDLLRLGVEVRTHSPVTAIESDAVTLASEKIPTHTVIWAAGVTASPLARTLGVPLDRVGRVSVEPDLTLKDHPEVFVIGDLATLVDPATNRPLPGVATVAIQQGRAAADNIWRTCQQLPSLPFRYRDRGSMATIGRARAVADLGHLKFSGFLAWLLWVVVHIYYLIGFEDRLLVMIQWAWAYFTLERGNRLITYNTAVPLSVETNLAVGTTTERQTSDSHKDGKPTGDSASSPLTERRGPKPRT
jgi:NADH dehydrogenase